MDRRIINAASSTLGYDVDEARVMQALRAFEGSDTVTLKHRLRERVEAFEAAGGRGVDLAEEIDDLRIALAARRVGRKQRER